MAGKILFCATVDYHFKAFHLPYLQWFAAQSWEVHVAAKGDMDLPYVDRKFDIPLQRSPFRRANVVAYRSLKKIIEKERYDIIHCHTPMGGVIARLAARHARKNGTKVIYTAHGFHFCKGAPLLNWLLYYPMEKALARLTDCLITINEEDYALAVRNKFGAARIEHVHGVGVSMDEFRPASSLENQYLRLRYSYNATDFLMFYAAEFNKNKNHRLLIEAMALLKDEAPDARLLLAGDGPLLSECMELAVRLEVGDRVDFLGYRDDIAQLLPMCDVAVSSSLREGLPVNIMEAMACGLPIVATLNRGHKELVCDHANGYIVAPEDAASFAHSLLTLYRSKGLRRRMGFESIERVHKYALAAVGRELRDIYMDYAGGNHEAQGEYHRAYL